MTAVSVITTSRSEESALFDFEVRFRATSLGEAGLLGCIERLRDEIMEDFPPEVLLQRPGAVGHLAALLRWAGGEAGSVDVR